jgi:hypothetical protein
MAFNNWTVQTLTGDGITADLIGQGAPGYEVVIASIWISNNAGSAATVTLVFTDSLDVAYFQRTYVVASGESVVANAVGSNPAFLVCLNNGDKVKAISDQADVAIMISKDETYTG